MTKKLPLVKSPGMNLKKSGIGYKILYIRGIAMNENIYFTDKKLILITAVLQVKAPQIKVNRLL